WETLMSFFGPASRPTLSTAAAIPLSYTWGTEQELPRAPDVRSAPLASREIPSESPGLMKGRLGRAPRRALGTGDPAEHGHRGPTLCGDRDGPAPCRPPRLPPRQPIAEARGSGLLAGSDAPSLRRFRRV